MLTSGLTVVGGLAVFGLQRFVLEPLNDHSKILGRIAYAVFYYGRGYGFPIDPSQAPAETQNRYWAAAEQIRGLAASLSEASQAVRLHWLWIPLGMTPMRKKINESIGLLTRMSNSFFAFDGERRTAQSLRNSADADEISRVGGSEEMGEMSAMAPSS